jgi:hypothetical protein
LLHAQLGAAFVIPSDGVEFFALLADRANLGAVRRMSDLGNLDPARTLIVVLGDNHVLNDLDREVGGLTNFLERGGALLVATDRPDEGRLRPFGLSVSGKAVNQDAKSAYLGNHECPLITKGLRTSHPLLKGLGRGLATNNPSFMRGTETDLHLLAAFNPDSYYGIDALPGWGLLFRADEGYVWGSSAEAEPGGRALFIAGHGVFMNALMVASDNDNADFARRCFQWLGEGPAGRREQAYIAVNGEAVTIFDPRPGIMPREPLINLLLSNLQREIDQMLLETVGRDPLLRGMLLAATAALLFFGVRRVMQSRHRLDKSAPLLVGLQQDPAIKPLLEQRQDALQETHNYWEPAQVLIRQWFLEHGSITVPWWEADTPAPALINAAPTSSKRLTQLVQQLWHWATAPPTGQLSARRFMALMADLEELTRAKREGRFGFGV